MCSSTGMGKVALRFKSKPALLCHFGGFFGVGHWCSHTGCAEC